MGTSAEPHARFVGRHQDVQRAGGVDLMCGDGVPRGTRHGDDGGLMQDVVDALHCPAAHFEARRTAADETDAVAHGTQMLTPARREIVEDDDVRALAHQTLDEVGADEPGAAGDQVSHARG